MSRAYTNDGKRRSSQTHAKRVHECQVCGVRLRGNGALTSHKRKHVREGTGPEFWDRKYPADAKRRLELVALALSAPGAESTECLSCLGYGHFREDGRPTIDGRDRKCLDCRGTGKA